MACASCLLELFNLALTCPGRYRELTGIDGEAKGGSPLRKTEYVLSLTDAASLRRQEFFQAGTPFQRPAGIVRHTGPLAEPGVQMRHA